MLAALSGLPDIYWSEQDKVMFLLGQKRPSVMYMLDWKRGESPRKMFLLTVRKHGKRLTAVSAYHRCPVMISVRRRWGFRCAHSAWHLRSASVLHYVFAASFSGIWQIILHQRSQKVRLLPPLCIINCLMINMLTSLLWFCSQRNRPEVDMDELMAAMVLSSLSCSPLPPPQSSAHREAAGMNRNRINHDNCSPTEKESMWKLSKFNLSFKKLWVD